jgi:hypothetical protein
VLDTPQRYLRAGSQSYPSPAAEPNADDSTTVYFGFGAGQVDEDELYRALDLLGAAQPAIGQALTNKAGSTICERAPLPRSCSDNGVAKIR